MRAETTDVVKRTTNFPGDVTIEKIDTMHRKSMKKLIANEINAFLYIFLSGRCWNNFPVKVVGLTGSVVAGAL